MSDSACRQFLRKSSDLWKELGPIVFALSTYVPTAAKKLWDDYTDPPLEGPGRQDEDLWVSLRTQAEADASFSKDYILDLLMCVQELCACLSPGWMEQGMALMLFPVVMCVHQISVYVCLML